MLCEQLYRPQQWVNMHSPTVNAVLSCFPIVNATKSMSLSLTKYEVPI